MESYVNQPFLDKRGKYARWGSYVGLGALFAGVLVTSRAPLIAYLLLLVGLLGATFGSYMSNRYVREPRADKTLDEACKSLDKRHALYHYYLPSHHVVASHYGLTIVVPKPQGGEIMWDGQHWRHKAGWRKLLEFFGEPGLGKPDQEAVREAEWVKEWIAKAMPEVDIACHGVVLFTNPKARLQVASPPVPAMAVSEFSDFLRMGLKGQATLSTATQKELRRVLDEVVAAG